MISHSTSTLSGCLGASLERRARRGRAREAPDRAGGSDFATQYRADVAFVMLLKGLRSTGGLLQWSELVRWLEGCRPGASAQLGQWRIRTALCELHWRGRLWLPACQFDPETGQLRPEWRRMMQRFGLNPSDPALLQWLSAPQPGPDPRSPAELLAGSPGDFEAAAQAAWGQTWAAAA